MNPGKRGDNGIPYHWAIYLHILTEVAGVQSKVTFASNFCHCDRTSNLNDCWSQRGWSNFKIWMIDEAAENSSGFWKSIALIMDLYFFHCICYSLGNCYPRV